MHFISFLHAQERLKKVREKGDFADPTTVLPGSVQHDRIFRNVWIKVSFSKDTCHHLGSCRENTNEKENDDDEESGDEEGDEEEESEEDESGEEEEESEAEDEPTGWYLLV